MESTKIVNALAALAQETRLEIYRYLVQAGYDGVAVGKIAGHFGLAAATLSFHLKTLKQAGLLQCKREGRSLIYSANYPAMNMLLAYLTENCCSGETCCETVSDLDGHTQGVAK